MIIVSLILFLIAALLGVYLLTYVLQGKETPKGITFTHGPMAAIALLLLIIYAFMHQPAPWLSVVIFILAALGGFVLFYRDLTGKSLPMGLALGHGLLAIIGFVSLLIFIFF